MFQWVDLERQRRCLTAKPGASPQGMRLWRNKRCKRVSIGGTDTTRVRGETRLQRWGSLMAMSPGTLSQANC